MGARRDFFLGLHRLSHGPGFSNVIFVDALRYRKLSVSVETGLRAVTITITTITKTITTVTETITVSLPARELSVLFYCASRGPTLVQ